MRVRPLADRVLGWAYRPDSDTVSSLSRGVRKLKKVYFNPGADRPHEGGNLKEALIEARKAEDQRRGIVRKRRRRRMAKKVNLKELQALKAGKLSKKKTEVEEPKSNGKMIPLKAICAELDLDPKATRVKLRRLIDKGEIDFHDHSSRWEFTPKQAREIREVLS
jgi:hypothetical protein